MFTYMETSTINLPYYTIAYSDYNTVTIWLQFIPLYIVYILYIIILYIACVYIYYILYVYI